jgi:DNA-directed RNA polymerase subunit RPC12/RpoP
MAPTCPSCKHRSLRAFEVKTEADNRILVSYHCDDCGRQVTVSKPSIGFAKASIDEARDHRITRRA